MRKTTVNKIDLERRDVLNRVTTRKVIALPTLPEIGYTPANLRYLRGCLNLTQKDMALLVNASVRSIQNWEAEPKIRSHRAMPIGKWRFLIDLIGIIK